MTASPVGRPLEPAILDWLELGPTEASDRLSERILETVEITPQRGRRLFERRAIRVALLAAGLAGAAAAGALVAGGLLPTQLPAPSAAPPAPTAATATGPPASPASTSLDLSPTPRTEALLRARFVPSRAAACETSTLVDAARAAAVYRQVGINQVPISGGPGASLTSQQAMVTDTVPPRRAVLRCSGGALDAASLYVVQFSVAGDSGENAAVGWPGTFFQLPDGSCDGSEPGYGRWPSTGLPDGRVACWVARDGVAWVAWSDQQGKLLYLASRPDGDLGALLTWWREVAPAWLEEGPV